MKAYLTHSNLDEKIDAWTKSLAPFDRPGIKPDPDRSALLVIDMQKYFTQESGGAFLHASAAVLPRIIMLIEEFRRRRLPVIFTRHVHEPGSENDGIMAAWWRELIMNGIPGSALDDRVGPGKDEIVIEKNRYSAFFETGLEKLLRSMKTDTLAITGVMTNLCCESTARDAFFRNFKVFFPMDATAAIDEAMHFGTLLNLSYGFARTIPAKGLIDLMGRAAERR